jgi:glycosyltransferase involved in cell wall biosynthesis
MRICLMGPVPPFRGGIAKYCYSLAQELEKRHELLLLSYQRQYPAFLYGKKPQIDPDIDREQITREFQRLSFSIDSASIVSWFETSREIIAFKPDLVILPWWVSYWAPMYLYLHHTLKSRGIRVVFLCINVFEHEASPFRNFLTRLLLKSADALIVHSAQELVEIRQLNGSARCEMHLLPLFGYDPVVEQSTVPDFNILFFGFVRPYKGLETLLRALNILKNRAVTLTIAGEFWNDKAHYLQLIEELGIGDRVTVIDRYLPDSEMAKFFSRADLVALPYLESRTSGIIATAYGFGKPVLATEVGGFREIVQDGSTGKIVPPNDPQAFAAGIGWFLEHGEIDFAKNIADFSRQKMSWASLVGQIETFAGG